MRLRASRARGTALSETAVTLSFALLTIYGAFQIGLMGYFQLQLDGATFFFTHAYASGTSQQSNVAAYDAKLAPLFPNVATASMTPIFTQPPNTTVPVNFTQWGTNSQRFGGVSLLRPQRLQATAQYSLAGGIWTSKTFDLTAGNVDARPVIGNHDDDAQGAGYNTQTVYNSLVDPIIGDDQNVPPYYFNLAFMNECDANFNDVTSPWSTCPADHNPNLTSLGLAEFLKDDNYATGGTNDGIDSDGTFFLMKCHQQIYAAISAFLALVPTRPPSTWKQNAHFWDKAMDAAGMSTVNSWDQHDVRGLHPNQSNLGRQNPLHPENGCS